MIGQREIKPKPDKIAAMRSPQTQKEANGGLALFQERGAGGDSGWARRAVLPRVDEVPAIRGVLQLYSARPESALNNDPIRDKEGIRRSVYCASRVVKLSVKHLPMDYH
ncbi:hypothetical protein LIER_13661 [Lithospermum erythrorhizon]|uniref:Uncharacterized protein n=1 Tax=Lithospermum erythrorhizon TaxID=34254 RepID=A0AAV3Q1I4_LITER